MKSLCLLFFLSACATVPVGNTDQGLQIYRTSCSGSDMDVCSQNADTICPGGYWIEGYSKKVKYTEYADGTYDVDGTYTLDFICRNDD